MEKYITVLTPVYLNAPERVEYLKQTFESFYRCNQFPGKIIHNLVDDRSPSFQEELDAVCAEHGVHLQRRFKEDERRGYFDIYRELVNSVRTPFFLYLEPDHYFYLPYDFITPVLLLFKMLPELHQVYLRAPLIYEKFRRISEDHLLSADMTLLKRIEIDGENVGWVGFGTGHESFSLMPSIFRTDYVKQSIEGRFIEGAPIDVETALAREWEEQKLVGYLNAQAFCYHIGKVGKSGPGGYLEINDAAYEQVWSIKTL